MTIVYDTSAGTRNGLPDTNNAVGKKASVDHTSPPHKRIPASIKIRPARITGILAALATMLLLLSLGESFIRYGLGHDYVFGLLAPARQIFNVDREQNIPTLFSVGLLLFAALLLGLITVLKRQSRDADVWKWMLLATGFTGLAIDEGWSFHERLIEPLRGLFGPGDLGIFYFAWIIPAMAGVCLLSLLFLGFLFRLPMRTRMTFLGAGVLYLGGAIGIEMLGGRYAELHGLGNLPYQLLAHLEEGMEMTGSIVFVCALLRYLEDQHSELLLQIDGQ